MSISTAPPPCPPPDVLLPSSLSSAADSAPPPLHCPTSAHPTAAASPLSSAAVPPHCSAASGWSRRLGVPGVSVECPPCPPCPPPPLQAPGRCATSPGGRQCPMATPHSAGDSWDQPPEPPAPHPNPLQRHPPAAATPPHLPHSLPPLHRPLLHLAWPLCLLLLRPLRLPLQVRCCL